MLTRHDTNQRAEIRFPFLVLIRVAAIAFASVLWVTPTVAQDAGDILIVPDVVDIGDGNHMFAERGYLFARENRDKRDSKLVAVHFMRFSSTAEDPGTPVFAMAGGPGGSRITDIKTGTDGIGHPADEGLALSLATLEDLRAVGDVVFIDQRGAGLSIPLMDCPNHQALAPVDQLLSAEVLDASYRKFAIECKQAWLDRGRDVDGYHALQLADDIDDLRLAFGYEKISLFAGSFGSQWGFTTLRRHPDIVERVVFRGLEGINHTFDMPTGILASVEAILAEAEKDADLAPHVPEGGFLRAIRELIFKLEDHPVTVQAEDPYTGELIDVVIGADELRRTWPGRVSRVSTQEWPASLLPALNGNFGEIAVEVARNKRFFNDQPTNNRRAMHYAIDCGLSPSGARREQLLADPAMEVLGNINAGYFAICDEWSAPNVSEEFLAPIQTGIPALFIQGTWDTSTPLMNALEIAKGFENGHLIIVDGGTHGVINDLYREKPDFIRPLIRSFLRGESIDGTTDRIRLPPVDFAGPGG